jgi:hypothetical protein
LEEALLNTNGYLFSGSCHLIARRVCKTHIQHQPGIIKAGNNSKGTNRSEKSNAV